MGTTHVKNLPNGDLIGICTEVSKDLVEMGQNYLTAYRITGENIHYREMISRIPTEGLVY